MAASTSTSQAAAANSDGKLLEVLSRVRAALSDHRDAVAAAFAAAGNVNGLGDGRLSLLDTVKLLRRFVPDLSRRWGRAGRIHWGGAVARYCMFR